ncbi:glycosyltransferase family 2 protein [Plastoroseomonas arctica]|uniref:Glycosyltransferase n=1 Tax=Plastoroseomonas arctica TaxID=1509237 RepID=A0AAF1JYV6_9PROT|nr:glycosyltransferase family 2 protein [Plastoroseomonas arctica]MBR0656260.1 glycosyltransferase [Plastoroseomonas arctica]
MRVTIAVVTLNAAPVLEATLASIAAQSFAHELVIVDGGSTDGTLAIAEAPRWRAAQVVSEPDRGPYDAMEKAARLATGAHILFMNAGDIFADPLAIEQAIAPAPDDADIIYGHHFWRTLDGAVALHRAADFEDTWQRLQRGDLHPGWQGGVPCHQATFTRRSLLLELGYDPRYRIAADHDFLYRARRAGARFHHAGIAIAAYAQGGMSHLHAQRCFHEWWEIAQRHGDAAAATAYFRARFGAAVTKDPALLAPRVAMLRASGMFFEDWYRVRQLAGRPHIAPIEHYIAEGAARGASPMPFFDPAFYTARYPEAADAHGTAFEHALRHGPPLGEDCFDWGDARHPLAPLRRLFDPARETLDTLVARICALDTPALVALFPEAGAFDPPAAEATPAVTERDGDWQFLSGVSEVEEGPYPELDLDQPFRWCVGENSAFRLFSAASGARGLRLRLRSTQPNQAITLLDQDQRVLAQASLPAAPMATPQVVDVSLAALAGAQTLVLRTARQAAPDALGRRVSVILEGLEWREPPAGPTAAMAAAPHVAAPPRILWSAAEGLSAESLDGRWAIGREATLVIEADTAVNAVLRLEYRSPVAGQQAMVQVDGGQARPFFARAGGDVPQRWDMPIVLRAGRTRVSFAFRTTEPGTDRALLIAAAEIGA